MIKVVYNDCHGGFALSQAGFDALMKGLRQAGEARLIKKYDLHDDGYGFVWDFPRHHPVLVDVVTRLGPEANGPCADLAIATIKGRRYRIEEYDGWESVVEPRDIKWVVVK